MFQYIFFLSASNILAHNTILHIEMIYNKGAFKVLNGYRDSLKCKSSLCEGCCHWLAAWNGDFLLCYRWDALAHALASSTSVSSNPYGY